MPRGVIKFYSEPRGYGYIRRDGGPGLRDEIYVHYSQIEGTNSPKEGQAVTFEIRDGDRGLEAVNVRLASVQ